MKNLLSDLSFQTVKYFLFSQQTDLITKYVGAMFVMLGMTSMLLRVLFSRKPTVFKDWCLESKKKEKTVFDTRCRCDKCIEKRKMKMNSSDTVNQEREPPQDNKTFIQLKTLKNRKTTKNQEEQEHDQRGEEIVLRVPNLNN